MILNETLGYLPDLTETITDSGLEVNNCGTVVDIEAIHSAPYVTQNFTRYMPECLNKSVDSWVSPYNIPVIKHHNDYDGEVIGRVLNAKLVDSTTLPGTKALQLTADIISPEARESVETGLLNTVSIGARASDVRCSICGAQLSKGEICSHEKGQTYDGKLCTWDVYEMRPKEVSYVIVPSDSYAQNIKVYNKETQGQFNTPNGSALFTTESAVSHNVKKEPSDKSMEDNKQLNNEPQVDVVDTAAPTAAEPTTEPAQTEPADVKESAVLTADVIAKLLEEAVQKVVVAREPQEPKDQEPAVVQESFEEQVTARIQELSDSVDALKASVENIVAMQEAYKEENDKKIVAVEESLNSKLQTIDITKSIVNDPTPKAKEVKVQESADDTVDFKSFTSRYFK